MTKPKYIALFILCLLFAGCAQFTSIFKAAAPALNVTLPVLLNALDAKNPKTNADTLASLYAAEVYFYKYNGLPLPAGLLDTGNAQVDKVIGQYDTGGVVTPTDINLIKNAITSLGGNP